MEREGGDTREEKKEREGDFKMARVSPDLLVAVAVAVAELNPPASERRKNEQVHALPSALDPAGNRQNLWS